MGGCLFHLTDEANFPLIEKHGLISKTRAFELGISPLSPGGNELTRALDSDYNLNGDVFLGFHTDVLMPKHTGYQWQRRPRTLQIDPNVLFVSGAKVALGRANHRGTEIVTAWRAPHVMDWEAYEAEPEKNDFQMKARKRRFSDYEVLIPDCVPVGLILGYQ